jgi:hypothetical protein
MKLGEDLNGGLVDSSVVSCHLGGISNLACAHFFLPCHHLPSLESAPSLGIAQRPSIIRLAQLRHTPSGGLFSL